MDTNSDLPTAGATSGNVTAKQQRRDSRRDGYTNNPPQRTAAVSPGCGLETGIPGGYLRRLEPVAVFLLAGVANTDCSLFDHVFIVCGVLGLVESENINKSRSVLVVEAATDAASRGFLAVSIEKISLQILAGARSFKFKFKFSLNLAIYSINQLADTTGGRTMQEHVTETAGELRRWSCKELAAALGIAEGSTTRVARALGLRTMRFFADPADDMRISDDRRWLGLFAFDAVKAWAELQDLCKRSQDYTADELDDMLKGGC